MESGEHCYFRMLPLDLRFVRIHFLNVRFVNFRS